MTRTITGISSMATKNALAELAATYSRESGQDVVIESVGGVTAADRIRAGKPFDFAVLSRDALQKLEADGHLVAGGIVDMARSPMAFAVRAGAPAPDIASEAAFRAAVEGAGSIGISTGPSGTYFQKLLASWGLSGLADRVKTAPPGVPVAQLIAQGQVEIGVQQLSELAGAPGIHVVGELPDAVQSITTFSASVCARAPDAAASQAFLRYLASPEAAAIKRRHGLK